MYHDVRGETAELGVHSRSIELDCHVSRPGGVPRVIKGRVSGTQSSQRKSSTKILPIPTHVNFKFEFLFLGISTFCGALSFVVNSSPKIYMPMEGT
jgi:hypothetical protein